MLAPFFLCWGSFLNVVAYRLIATERFNLTLILSRSACPHCKKKLAWFDLIPLFSYCFLRGRCRTCNQPISWLYPFIELITMIALSTLLIIYPNVFFFGYFILFSALIVSIRTDLETMLISPLVTIVLAPLGIIFSASGLLPLWWLESLLGCIVGYGFLYVIGKIFYRLTNKEGVGEGDFDLLALIGAFTGLIGLWFTLLVGSVVGSILSALFLLITKKDRSTPIPFGPFLALGAISYVLLQPTIIGLFFSHF